jgi:phenylacetate-CoA ligase
MKDLFKETTKYFLRAKPFIHKEIREVERLHSLHKNELEELKEKKFLKLFRCAYNKSKFYRQFYMDHGIQLSDIQTIGDLPKLPVLTKEMVKKHHKNMLTVPRWKVKSAKTSGTTGSSLTVYHSYNSIRMEQAYIYVQRRMYGFTLGEKIASIRGNMIREKFKLYVPISKTMYLSSYSIKEDMAERYFEELKSFKPKAIEGYPSSLYNVCLLFEKKGWQLDIPVCFTSSETLLPFQRELIGKIFKTEVFDHYGCTERTIFLSEKNNHEGYKEAPAYSVNEFREESVITTSLINYSFPLIRYQMNDRINVEKDGDGKIIIQSISGRKEDIVVCKDGTKVGRLDHIFKNTVNIKNAQIIQHKAGEIIINVVPENNVLSEESKNNIVNEAIKRFGVGNMNITVNRIEIEEIIYSKNRKYKLVITTL